jgi:hypothetical protein
VPPLITAIRKEITAIKNNLWNLFFRLRIFIASADPPMICGGKITVIIVKTNFVTAYNSNCSNGLKQ